MSKDNDNLHQSSGNSQLKIKSVLEKDAMRDLFRQARNMHRQGLLAVPVNLYVPRGKDKASKPPPDLARGTGRFNQDNYKDAPLPPFKEYVTRAFDPSKYVVMNAIGVAVGPDTYQGQAAGCYSIDFDLKHYPAEEQVHIQRVLNEGIQIYCPNDAFFYKTVNGGWAMLFRADYDVLKAIGEGKHNPDLVRLWDKGLVEMRTNRYQVIPPTQGYEWLVPHEEGEDLEIPYWAKDDLARFVGALKSLIFPVPMPEKIKQERKKKQTVQQSVGERHQAGSFKGHPVKAFYELYKHPADILIAFNYTITSQDGRPYTAKRPGDGASEVSGRFVYTEGQEPRYVEYSTEGIVNRTVGRTPQRAAELFASLHGVNVLQQGGGDMLKAFLWMKGFGRDESLIKRGNNHDRNRLFDYYLQWYCQLKETFFCPITKTLWYRPQWDQRMRIQDDDYLSSMYVFYHAGGLHLGREARVDNAFKAKKLVPLVNRPKDTFEACHDDHGETLKRFMGHIELSTEQAAEGWDMERLQAFITKFLLKWMAGVIAQARHAEVDQEKGLATELMPYLYGPQAAHKGRIVDWLVKLIEDYVQTSLPRKDMEENLVMSTKLVVVDDEGRWCSKGEAAHIKALLSRKVIQFRKNYAIDMTSKPRRVSMIATGNDSHMINDTENRRYVPFPILAADIEAIEAMDVKPLWGRARAMLDADPLFIYVHGEDMDDLKAWSEGHLLTSNAKEWLDANIFIEPPNEGNACRVRMKAVDLRRLAIAASGRSVDRSFSPNVFSQLLRDMGFQVMSLRINGKVRRGIEFWADWTEIPDRYETKLQVPGVEDDVTIRHYAFEVVESIIREVPPDEEEDKGEDGDDLPF